MSIFAIGDTHLSLGTNKPMDVFSGWEDYVSRLEKNWKKIVKPEDTVVIPGDISWALNLSDTEKDFEFLNSLPGTKIISKGNHDYWWETMAKMNSFLAEKNFATIKFMHNNAFAVEGIAVCGTRGWFFDDTTPHSEKIINRERLRLETSIAMAEETGLPIAVFLHYPPITRERVCEPFMDILISHKIKRCYYAHLHGPSISHAFIGEYENIKFSLVSADSLGFVPKLITL